MSNDITAQTGGAQLNFVTKRAGHRTSGDFHLYVEDEKWEMKQDRTQYMIDNDFVVPGIFRLYQYGVNIGGPIVKDKLWWLGSWAVQDIHKRTESNIEDATWLVSGYGKLNFQLGNTSVDFHLSYDAKMKWGRVNWSVAQQMDGSLWDQTRPGYLYYGGLSHVVGDLMLNAKVLYTDGGFALNPRGADIIPATGHNEGAECLIVDWNLLLGANDHYMTNRNSINVSFDGNYFLEGALSGDYEIRFVVDYFTADTTSQVLYPNQRNLYVYRGFPQYNWMWIYSDYVVDVNFKRVSAYIQDTITWGKLTASFGVRYDKESGRVNPLFQPAFQWYEPGYPHHGEVLWPEWNTALEISELFKSDADWSLISPRIYLTYDITGDGKNVVKLSAARYMGQSGNTIGGAYAPWRWADIGWLDANGDNTPQYEELGEVQANYAFLSQDPNTGLNNVQWDPDYNTPLLDDKAYDTYVGLNFLMTKKLSNRWMAKITGMYQLPYGISLTTLFQARKGNLQPLRNTTSLNQGRVYLYEGNSKLGDRGLPTFYKNK